MYVLKTTIEEELLVYIRDAATPKVAYDTLATLFSKKNDARLQLLESELMTINQPQGFETKAHPEYVCKLKKELHGLKQAPRAWYGKITEFLVQSSYTVTVSDSSLFTKEVKGKSPQSWCT
ncbi:reverse transcriptase [Rhynchospora pubera]|uniref:Reverse transcriptase n=1 Tax=Rhynchospora pubera TaxID=906938 RepID=A0AAV8FDN0_9POAL|nr:reverse transcriptase [Rhynchospora pubera]